MLCFKQWFEDTGEVNTTTNGPFEKKGAKSKYSQPDQETEKDKTNIDIDKLFGKEKKEINNG